MDVFDSGWFTLGGIIYACLAVAVAFSAPPDDRYKRFLPLFLVIAVILASYLPSPGGWTDCRSWWLPPVALFVMSIVIGVHSLFALRSRQREEKALGVVGVILFLWVTPALVVSIAESLWLFQEVWGYRHSRLSQVSGVAAVVPTMGGTALLATIMHIVLLAGTTVVLCEGVLYALRWTTTRWPVVMAWAMAAVLIDAVYVPLFVGYHSTAQIIWTIGVLYAHAVGSWYIAIRLMVLNLRTDRTGWSLWRDCPGFAVPPSVIHAIFIFGLYR